jgi:hypothetical protein
MEMAGLRFGPDLLLLPEMEHSAVPRGKATGSTRECEQRNEGDKDPDFKEVDVSHNKTDLQELSGKSTIARAG